MGPTLVELKSHPASITHTMEPAASNSLGSAAEAGKIPAGCSLGTPLLSPGRREAADAAAMASSMSREALACVASAAMKVGHISGTPAAAAALSWLHVSCLNFVLGS